MLNVLRGLKNHSQPKAEADNVQPVYCQALCYRPPFGLSTGESLWQVNDFLKERSKSIGFRVLLVTYPTMSD